MKRGWLMAIVAGMALPVLADSLLLTSGLRVTGTFEGFADGTFVFKGEDGGVIRESPVKVSRIEFEKPVQASIRLVSKAYESVALTRYEGYQLRFEHEGKPVSAGITLVKDIERVADAPVPAIVPAAQAEAPRLSDVTMQQVPRPAVRNWQRSGKWAEVQVPGCSVISRGEVVDVEAAIRKGSVTIVHFHYPAAHSSVRQGNYIETIVGKNKGRMQMLRVEIPGWEAPICKALELKSLPQFWFYNAEGTLVRKLKERFTESDIDKAIVEARTH